MDNKQIIYVVSHKLVLDEDCIPIIILIFFFSIRIISGLVFHFHKFYFIL